MNPGALGGRLTRRRLLGSGAAGLVSLAAPWATALAAREAAGRAVRGYGPLRADPSGVLDLPAGFAYRILSRAGEPMDDGLRVPDLADGMHAFDGGGGLTVLVRNHELDVGDPGHAFAGLGAIPQGMRERLYDSRVGAGGVTTLVLEEGTGRVRRQFLSLAGTLRNCAGGATPWGSWLSCEESVVARGERGAQRDHGFAFEVPAAARELVPARPISAMGRFHREAVAVDPATGIVYQSEDRTDGLLYRYLPREPGRLHAGGTLQALCIRGMDGVSTDNASGAIAARQRLPVRWITLDGVQSARDDLRRRGRAAGACAFRRGEGMAVDAAGPRPRIWLVCTDGGPRGLGQLWCYHPSPHEARAGEAGEPGTLELFLQPDEAAMPKHGDNLALAPGGDLLVCEDRVGVQHVVGVTGDGGVYPLARNPRADSEFAGATFAPGGRVLYLNLQRTGLTLAVTGPWTARIA